MQYRIAELETALASTSAALASTSAALESATKALKSSLEERERLQAAYQRVLESLSLLQRRLFLAKRERPISPVEQLAFEELLQEAERLAKELEEAKRKELEAAEKPADDSAAVGGDGGGAADPQGKPKGSVKPKGRRNLNESDLPIERVEILDPSLAGVKPIRFEETSKLGYRPGHAYRIVLARAVYQVTSQATSENAADSPDAVLTDAVSTDAVSTDAVSTDAVSTDAVLTDAEQPTSKIVTAALPKCLFPRYLLAPSMISYILVSKYVMGVPFYRLEDAFEAQGTPIDRGTMSRYAEEVGATLGAIVLAARDEALVGAFCLSTDATGVAIQPGKLEGREKGPCRKGHFFVVLADRDYVFFEYQPKHTSAAVCEMFKGYQGYIQADAHSVYDALFRTLPTDDDPDGTGPPIEVGCFSHARRKFWEAASCKHQLGVDGLRLLDAIFLAERALGKMPPSQRHAVRQELVRPKVDAFFTWAKVTHESVKERGLVDTALGYAVRQEQPLRRFLDDGRLKLDNNAAERALRTIATGRKAWLFCGSDDHASAAANLFSLVASCKLHNLEPQAYLAEVIHVMAYWPRNRYLELTPKHWAATRARLDPKQLAIEVGPITVPDRLAAE